jgi:hypothetical protein
VSAATISATSIGCDFWGITTREAPRIAAHHGCECLPVAAHQPRAFRGLD